MPRARLSLLYQRDPSSRTFTANAHPLVYLERGMLRILVVAIATVLAFAEASYAQEHPPERGAATAAEITIESWEQLQAKIVAMARDFPEDLFAFQPHPDSRSFADEIWHIASGNQVLAARIRGEPLSARILTTPEGAQHDRTMMVARLTASAQECVSLLREQFDARSIRVLEHVAEHYGKLVTIYRVNGLVPPASREAR